MSDAIVGFLPPNVMSPEGEGFVDYTIRPKSSLPTATVIEAVASIVFDANAALLTPIFTNTIDAGDPSSHVNPLSTTVTTNFEVSWGGEDDAGGPAGAGIALFDVFVSDNGGPFLPFMLG